MMRGSHGNGHSQCLRVLGVDPAAAGPTGYGVIELEGPRARALRFGALKFPARSTSQERLREIHRLIVGLLDEFHPHAMAVESVFAALNVRTALKLAEVRGVVLLAAAQAGVPAHSYSPREVKASVTGYGAASKEQMQEMIRALFGLRECPQPADAADAMAVALCHAQLAQFQNRLSDSEKKTAATGTNNSARPGGARKSPARIAVMRVENAR
jgi:crossover junction endodeoxyribonuclease RuvC